MTPEDDVERTQKPPWPLRWLWERPVLVVAAYAGMVAVDLIDRWPPAWTDVALLVIAIPPFAYMILRREHLRERYEAQQHAPPREPVEVRAGVRGIWDRLWNLDLAIERWRWSEPLAVGFAFRRDSRCGHHALLQRAHDDILALGRSHPDGAGGLRLRDMAQAKVVAAAHRSGTGGSSHE